jgi:tRNA (cytidine/uridine-2'-O-)-methyltransferase
MQIVLVEPEIPQNTGSIARTCAALNTPLHLVGKLGFDISQKAVRRAGLDYWPHVNLKTHESWNKFIESENPKELWYFTTSAQNSIYQVSFTTSATLVFGSETKGLGSDFLSKVPESNKLKIPILNNGVRSLNLSNAVSIALYETLRQVM